MLANIPQNRLIIYVLVLGLIPFFLVGINFWSKSSTLDDAEKTLQTVNYLALTKKKKQETNIAVRNSFREADHFYIDKNLETLDFLENEVESLQKVQNNKNFPDDENIKKRLEFLTGPGNKMIFTEGVVQSNPFFQEVTETLVHPVEVNVKDIRTILAKIEGTEIGNLIPNPSRPQLQILDFKLEKKHLTEKNEVFILNLKLLKREFL